ncbi:MAG: hypothetical protein RMJ98_03945 [Myxococcales bacterium]|nr:hypothetical protein [Polyangiaceae bacterium]MDW8248441.1 hypothetical protein [Myxococcales bacterium]
MPVYAYDVPPYLYVRLAPHIGADLAVVGPLPNGAYEHVLGEHTLFSGLQRSSPVQVLLDVSRCPDLTPSSLRWIALVFAPGLADGGTRALALVLPPSLGSLSEELRSLAVQHTPALAFACFPDATSAVFWLATRVPGVGVSSTPEEVRQEAAQGRWVEAVARYRALTASPLTVAVEVVEGLLREVVRPEGTEPSSLVPSTEVPLPEDKGAPVPVIFPADPVPEPAMELPSSTDPSSGAGSTPSELPASASMTTQASLGQAAETAAQLATAPTQFQDELTTARELDDSLFLSDGVVPEEEFLGSRLRDIEPMLRSILTRVWFAPSADGETLLYGSLDEGQGIEVHEESRDGALLALGGSHLGLLLQDGPRAIRFGPGSLGEVTLRSHQFALAREVLSGLLMEEHLDQLPVDPPARERCLHHRFLVLLDRSNHLDRVLILPGPSGREALLFTLPDVLHRYLRRRPAVLGSRPLGILTEQGDSLLEKLLILPLDGVVINPDGPAETRLTRVQLKEILRPGGVSLPPAITPPAEATSDEKEPSLMPTVVAPLSYPLLEPSPVPVSSQALASSASSRPSVAPPCPSSGPPHSSVQHPASVTTAPVPGSPAAPGVAHDVPPVPRRLTARSLVEAHFYMDLRGFERQERYQCREERGGEVIWVFLVKGPGDRQERLEFSLLNEILGPQDGYFGPGPSPLLGPVELIQQAGVMIRAASGTPLGLSQEELTQATSSAEMAYLLVMEALRHYGGEDAPPPSSLKTEEERQMLARDPERFQRVRVEELARSYWYIATQLGEALRGRP